ncbi:hypothetical protein BJX61DRAFT_552704 [Aspergillus egyptiacus]|nr:hypothetical protein BJX61DRAFT_552704 [Aspergillus egyptiacus]
MTTTFDPIGLTPIDHITAKVFLPYMLYFTSKNPQAAAQALENGITALIAKIPWLAGDVVIHTQPETRAFIHPPATSPRENPTLTVKHFDNDADFRTHPTKAYLPIPLFVPASQPRPVLRFQANLFPTKVALVMSFNHMVFDGSGAATVLQALSECCRESDPASMPVTQTIARDAIALRHEVSTWPSKCLERLDHSLELGPPLFDSNISIEQWGAMESSIASVSETRRVRFSAEKVARLKAVCTSLSRPGSHRESASESSPFSSNDLITAALGLAIDRTMRPSRTPIDAQPHIFMVADLRRRITPPLPDTYVGNMIYPIWRPIPIQDMNPARADSDLHALTTLAGSLRTALTDSVNTALAYSVSATVAQDGDWFRCEGKPADVVMTSWRHLKVFSLDFGPALGYIEDFESGFVMMPGACIVLPERRRETKSESGKLDWEVSVTLRPGDWEGFWVDPFIQRISADM